jgi:2-oxoisovalerate dehydrogenase E2 component (dihydrolipoyl transacylase)
VARVEFKLPDIGEGLAEAEIVAWHAKPGDVVEEDAPLADLMTDKATVEMTSPVAGKLVEVAGAVGDQVAIGSVLAVFESEEEGEKPSPQRGEGWERGGLDQAERQTMLSGAGPAPRPQGASPTLSPLGRGSEAAFSPLPPSAHAPRISASISRRLSLRRAIVSVIPIWTPISATPAPRPRPATGSKR